MRDVYDRFICRLRCLDQDNKGVAAVEIILILVVLIGLVIIFKNQAVSLVTKIWNTITDDASVVTG